MVSAPPPGQQEVKATMEVTDTKQPAAKKAPQAVAAQQCTGNAESMIVPDQIAFANSSGTNNNSNTNNNNEASGASGSNKEESQKKPHRHHHRKHRHSRSSKDKDKIATKKAGSGKHHKRRHRHHHKSSKDGNDKSPSKDGKEHRHHHRRRKKDKMLNDTETIRKSQELLLASMGVPKPPDTEPCFVSQKSDFESSNPVYQCNKKRFSHTSYPSLLPLPPSEPKVSSTLSSSRDTSADMETASSSSSSADRKRIPGGGDVGVGNGLGTRRGSLMYGHYIEF